MGDVPGVEASVNWTDNGASPESGAAENSAIGGSGGGFLHVPEKSNAPAMTTAKVLRTARINSDDLTCSAFGRRDNRLFPLPKSLYRR